MSGLKNGTEEYGVLRGLLKLGKRCGANEVKVVTPEVLRLVYIVHGSAHLVELVSHHRVLACKGGDTHLALKIIVRIVSTRLSLALLYCERSFSFYLLLILFLSFDEYLLASFGHLSFELLSALALSYHYLLFYTVSVEKDI